MKSMTGFAAAKGALGPYSWAWELRGVNAKGLDIRLRLPDWLPGLEARLRAQVAGAVTRGNISLSLKISRADTGATFAVDPTGLAAALDALAVIETEAEARGLTPAPWTSADVLQVRGVYDVKSEDAEVEPLVEAMDGEFAALVADFLDMRSREGAALKQVLADQLNQIAGLTEEAADLAQARKPAMAESFRASLARVLDETDRVEPDRIAQELAILAVKADVTEEIDRLGAHVTAARALLDVAEPVGRKLDFLMQEFNREANTLCSKSQSSDLTSVGLELKAVIDRMREQVQNVE